MLQRLRFLACVLPCLAAIPAPAVEPAPAAEFRADCKAWSASPDAPAGRRCLAYIQGFIDGAVVANMRIVQGVSEEFEAGETYSQRAKRTRLRERNSRNPAWYTGICIPDTVTIGEAAAAVVEQLDAIPAAPRETAATVLYSALRARFPCRPTGN
ncbi:MAG TPA: Rap1a/Tai family immunity protein [Steroidobacteraceae bacterium]|nr:Rap1a/Tai family immunity protein [Steroidobacteraceae bacterium]